MKARFLITSFLLIAVFGTSQTVFTSVQNGNWDDGSTWSLSSGLGGTVGVDYPAATDSVYIEHDVVIDFTNSGSSYIFEGYLNVSAGDKLQCAIGDANNGFILDNGGVFHLYGTFYVATLSDTPASANPTAKELTCRGTSQFVAFDGAYIFVADDWAIEENTDIYVETNVCIRVDDDVNFNNTGWFLCGDGDISI
ncbi:unnamed protein product, partial [Chrysoparadoxa australica]